VLLVLKFVFEKVTTNKVEKIMNNINIKKATGADGIPANIIKCSKFIIAPQITSILNMSIDQSVFPDKLKKAQVTPLGLRQHTDFFQGHSASPLIT
jgi:hypothetical protein